MTLMFLNGTAMSGQKDHACHAGSTFLGPARTACAYRFFAVRDEYPELFEIPEPVLRNQLLPAEPAELELGMIQLIDGEEVHAMLLRPERLKAGDKVVDISELGGFRAYMRFLAANRQVGAVLGRPEW